VSEGKLGKWYKQCCNVVGEKNERFKLLSKASTDAALKYKMNLKKYSGFYVETPKK
jgi:hypothetical protein